jgi:hypothetical protein
MVYSMPSDSREFMDPIPVRMTRELFERVEIFRHDQPGGEPLTMSAAIRMLMSLGLDGMEKMNWGHARGKRRRE